MAMFGTLALMLRHGVDRPYLGRAFQFWLNDVLLTPYRLAERLTVERKLSTGAPLEAPIFVLGHWRSGTTLLHSLLCQDPQFGYMTTLQAFVPDGFIAGARFLRPYYARILPKHRPMDKVERDIDSPHEEEFALSTSRHSFYHGYFTFPRELRNYAQRYLFFEGGRPAELAGWKRDYRRVLRKASLHAGGRRLVLKNPPNTARLRVLAEMFPDARFVHIYRNPYAVFVSTRHMWQKMAAQSALQQHDPARLDDDILWLYAEMMRRFEADRAALPANRLVELSCETLEADPVAAAAEIYRALDLPGFAAAEPALSAFAQKQRTFEKNRFSLEPALVEKVSAACGPLIAKWGYTAPPAVPDCAPTGT